MNRDLNRKIAKEQQHSLRLESENIQLRKRATTYMDKLSDCLDKLDEQKKWDNIGRRSP